MTDQRAPDPAIASLWAVASGHVQEQFSAIAALADALGDADPDRVEDACRQAHKLAGSLGSYGSMEGSAVAKRIEVALAEPPLPDPDQLKADVEELQNRIQELDRSLSSGASGDPASPPPEVEVFRVLAVDDDPTIPPLVAAELARVGGQVIAASTPDEMREQLAGDPFDVVLLDLDLGGVPGLELCRELRADPRAAHVSIIVITASPSADAMQEAFAAGADDYISKPIVPAELLARISARRRAPAPPATFDVDVAIVEDDDATAALLTHLMARDGLTHERFKDGDAALALAEGKVSARVILLDVGLPGIDGFGVLRKLSAAGALDRSKVLMLTARSGESEVLRALELGASDHIQKPFSLPILSHRISQLLGTRSAS